LIGYLEPSVCVKLGLKMKIPNFIHIVHFL